MLNSIAYSLGRLYGRLPTPARVIAIGLLLFAFVWALSPSGERPESETHAVMPSQVDPKQARLAALTPEQRIEEEKNAAMEAAEKRRKDDAIQRASSGAIVLKKSMRDPDSFKLESALVINGTGAVCYDYRAKNGFGGTNVGHAVLSADGKQFRTSEMEGFTKMWNKECAHKSGTETATAIRWFVL